MFKMSALVDVTQMGLCTGAPRMAVVDVLWDMDTAAADLLLGSRVGGYLLLLPLMLLPFLTFRAPNPLFQPHPCSCTR